MCKRLIIKEGWNRFARMMDLGGNFPVHLREMLESSFYAGYDNALNDTARLILDYQQTNNIENLKKGLGGLSHELDEWKNPSV